MDAGVGKHEGGLVPPCALRSKAGSCDGIGVDVDPDREAAWDHAIGCEQGGGARPAADVEHALSARQTRGVEERPRERFEHAIVGDLRVDEARNTVRRRGARDAGDEHGLLLSVLSR